MSGLQILVAIAAAIAIGVLLDHFSPPKEAGDTVGGDPT